MNNDICPLCRNQLAKEIISKNDPDDKLIDCPVCGEFILVEDATHFFLYSQENVVKLEDLKNRAILSYALRKIQKKNKRPRIDSTTLEAIFQNQDLPSPAEQANNLILYVGDEVQYPGKYIELKSKIDFSRIGAIDDGNFKFIRDKLGEKGFLLINRETQKITSTLSFEGWERYGELGRGRTDSTKAFMAMPFGYTIINELFNQYKEASKKAGFNLIKNDEDRKAGSIDDKIRVNILSCRVDRFLQMSKYLVICWPRPLTEPCLRY